MKSSKSMDNLARTVIDVKYQYSKSIVTGKRIVPPPPYPPSCRFVRDYIETKYSLSITKKIRLWNMVVKDKYWI
ncbi:hypothetical protein AXI64_gp123 [Vibrio phage qdvp001]|uniref:hypothetical protein n=1 Tax=Vibrio phage qdvp001 TaxID=1003177 RepID=UPI000720DB7E|nr:hypothetical protein AXI64_gp123 [Vibrio phage qdvp001]ALM62115.1 hypothetical protein qdvp001_123 [Vibrio phage qdvp001]